MSVFEEYVDQVETALLSYVEHGSDQELFLSSYLQGHVDVVIAEHFIQQCYQPQSVYDAVKSSLATAFENQELEQDDQVQVQSMWSALHTRALG